MEGETRSPLCIFSLLVNKFRSHISPLIHLSGISSLTVCPRLFVTLALFWEAKPLNVNYSLFPDRRTNGSESISIVVKQGLSSSAVMHTLFSLPCPRIAIRIQCEEGCDMLSTQ